MLVRPATPDDAADIARIHDEGIADRIATFETDPRDPVIIAERIGAGELYLMAERDGEPLGWAAVLPYTDRCAYAGVGEYTVYVARAARGQGVGSALLEALAAAAREQGRHKLIGRILAGNDASRGLAERCGFRVVGTHERHGRLDGQWRDVTIVERLL